MDNITFKVTLLLLAQLVVEISGQSPCPHLFRYILDEQTQKTAAHIEIRNAPIGTALHLKVELSIAALLPSKYVGRLELEQSAEQSFRDVYAGRPLKYRLHFPVHDPLPVLTALLFNNQVYCTGKREVGQIVTAVYLEHTLTPPEVVPLSEGQGNSILYSPPLTGTLSPTSYPVVQPKDPWLGPYNNRPSNYILNNGTNEDNGFGNDTGRVNHEDCGRSDMNSGNINLLIARGTKTTHGQWPWIVAIFVAKLLFEYQCGGTLVTNKHVITAAHCLKLPDDMTLPASTLLVSIGRHHLRQWRERGSVNREVEDYQMHPNYKRKSDADSDLAVLLLREIVEFSPVIKPICMWRGSKDLANIVKKDGYVVGWGRDHKGNDSTVEPYVVQVPIVSTELCRWANSYFALFTSDRTICAGRRDGSGPCNGDSGSGLVLWDRETRRYYLRGIVSVSLPDEIMSCDLTEYVVYTDVAKHLDWIQEQLANSGSSA